MGHQERCTEATQSASANRADRVLMRFLLRRRAWRGLGANRVSDHRVGRSRVAIIRVALDERMIDERG